MDFKNIDKKYRPVPFWSWNEKLNVPESIRQTALMDEVGIGGYFMHARGGLQTEYMGEEWFDNVYAACDEGEKRGMRSWAYDENGWPSGFGDGKVNGLGIEYQQKYLRCAEVEEPIEDEFTISPQELSGLQLSDNPEEAFLQLYDPTRDSKWLKASPEKFEWFRGNYPIRREI